MIPAEITSEVGELLERLEALGYSVADALYSSDSFGNWLVDLHGPRPFRIVKDRGQYFVDGDRASLEQYHLERAYDSLGDFAGLLLGWAATSLPAERSGILRSPRFETLFDQLCEELGLCLSQASQSRVIHHHAGNPRSFTDAVLAEEGLDPAAADRQLHRRALDIVSAVFNASHSRSA